MEANYQEKQVRVSLLMTQMCLLFFLALFGEISSQDWDGVVVTESDYQSLQALKHELVDPNGVLRSWNDTGLGACSGAWIGIKCAQGQVIVIQLPWRGLSGRLTEKIGQFQALRKLSFHDNSIGGAIPMSLGFLPYLRGVQLFNNRFSGSIPASLGLCPLLQTLELSNNTLSGVVPESLVNSTKLIRLSLGYNSLTGPIPERFAQSPSLVFLDLQRNNLSGPIPDSWGGNGKVLFQLQSLTLSHNHFTGSIPSSIGNLKGLRRLDLSGNSFNGSLPGTLFDNLENLSLVNLSNNNFQGQIPGAIGELPRLESFDVSYNNLSGPVPVSLSQKFNSSAFAGNLNLCGYTPSIPCPLSHPPQPAPSSGRHRKLSTKDIILIVAGVLLIILLITCCILICCLMKKRQVLKEVEEGEATPEKAAAAGTGRGKKAIPPSAAEVEPSGGKLVHFDGNVAFTADDLLCATAEILGKSTYGTVYKATMGDGIQVAVKRLREKITRGQRDFEAHASGLGEVRHPNLVPLRAYYFGPKGEKLLVFDYMPNGSLASFLHAREHGIAINWARRIKIIKDMARGLLHLHKNANIIHGNLTSSNVLLDDKVNAKIGDFGLSRLMMDVANANVVATAGALGYRAPELSKLKKATTKSDVYSFGVIMLELLTGKSPAAEEAMDGLDLPRWVASIVKEEWTNEVFDVELMKDASAIGDELLNVLKLAMHCVDPTPSARPEVEEILRQLEEIVAETSGGVESESPGD